MRHLEVIGHKEALDFVVQLAGDHIPISEREIREVHSLVMKGQGSGDTGRYRTLDVKAAGTEYIYPSHLKVPELMEEFIKWLASPLSIHPAELADEAHLRFVTIHPFTDGNGRVGRLLLNLMLLRHGYPIAVLNVAQGADYIAALEEAQSGGSREALTGMILEAIARSFHETLETALSSEKVGLSTDDKNSILDWLQAGGW